MKKISPAALNSLKDALSVVYWYKRELRSFLTNCLTDDAILARLDWQDYKRNIVDELVDHLAKRQSAYLRDLLRLMSEVARFDDFSHLEGLEDGEQKAARARTAVAALQKHVTGHLELAEERRVRRSTAFTRRSGVNWRTRWAYSCRSTDSRITACVRTPTGEVA